LIAFAAPALFITVLIGINHFTGLGRFVWTRSVPIWAAYPLVVLLNTVVGIPLTFGEEYGWRGYLLPRLLPLGEVRATLLLGTIWGLWHLPALLIGLNYPGQPLWAALLVFTVNILLLAFPFTWLFMASTGSPLVVAVMHASLNAAGDGFTSPTYIPHGNPLIVGGGGLMTAPLMLVIVVIRYTIFKKYAERMTAKSLKPELRGNRLDWLR
jgi:CAAX protease family protein